jgi:hypothetical protein
MNSDLVIISIILSILALGLAGFACWQNYALAQIKKSFFGGTKPLDIENTILQLRQRLDITVDEQAVLDQNLKQLQYTSGFMAQKIGLVRFNPFKDGGGNFSFCLALLDAHDNGVVVTSMYGREQNRIYAKKIQSGRGDTQLNEEEEKAIASANSKNQDPKPKKTYKTAE